MFSIHTKHVAVPLAGIERHDVYATCDRTGRSNVIGDYRRLTKPHEQDLFLLDLTTPAGERRGHFVDGSGEAMILAKAAYNPGRGYDRDLVPTSTVTFIRWQNPECDGADIYAAGTRVGCIVETDDEGYDICFDARAYEDPHKAGLSFKSACNAARLVIEQANESTPGDGGAATAPKDTKYFMTRQQAEGIVRDGCVSQIKLNPPGEDRFDEKAASAPRYELQVDGKKVGVVYQNYEPGLNLRSGKPKMMRRGWRLETGEDRPRFGPTVAALKVEAVLAAHCQGWF